MCSYENVRIETADLLLKKAMQDDWKDMYENLWQYKESAKYMLWNVTTSEADAFSRSNLKRRKNMPCSSMKNAREKQSVLPE